MTGVRVLSEKCSTCIFRPGNLMGLQPGRVRDMVEQCLAREGVIPCHKFLDKRGGRWVAGDKAKGAVCRGFYDGPGGNIPMLQIANRLGFIEFVDPPKETVH